MIQEKIKREIRINIALSEDEMLKLKMCSKKKGLSYTAVLRSFFLEKASEELTIKQISKEDTQ